MNEAMKNLLIRILLSPAGLLVKLYDLAKEGSRDIHNRIRFGSAIIENGSCIDPDSSIEPDVHVFEKCLINNTRISSYTYLGRNSIVQNSNIGRFCSIANEVFIGPGNHPVDDFSTSPLFYRVINPLNIKLVEENSNFKEYQPVNIGNDVWIGARAIILDGVKIGHGAIIAANSVVTKDVPPYSIVGGAPARIIKYRFDTEKIKYLLDLQWWTWDLDEIKLRNHEIKKFMTPHPSVY